MYPTREQKPLQPEDLPELETQVRISGSSQQQEVGGAVCVGIAAGIAVYYAM